MVKGMNWVELEITTTAAGVDVVYARLDALGISQIEIRQGREELKGLLEETSKYWDFADLDEIGEQNDTSVVAYWADLPENRALLEAVSAGMQELKSADIGIDLGSLNLSHKIVGEEDWANNWKAYYKPIEVGGRLLICPSWEKPVNRQGRVVLLLDPGMAFGTGNHHTTRMCLELIEAYMGNGARMLDIGCGSGILAIAGLLLGAKAAVGIDIDPAASRVAVENAALNGLRQPDITFETGDILAEPKWAEKWGNAPFDIVTANIVAGVIIPLMPMIPQMLKKNGFFIASGIIADRAAQVEAAAKDSGLHLVNVVQSGDWFAMLAQKAV